MATVTIGNLIRPARGAMILSGLLIVAGAVLSIVPSVALTRMAAIWLGRGRHEGWTASPWSWAAMAIVALLAYQLFYLVGLGVTHLTKAKLRHQLRGLLVGIFNRLPLGKVAQAPHGAIRETVCGDTAAIHALVAHVPDDVTSALVNVVTGAVYLFWTGWRLALALIGLWVLIIAVIAVTTMCGLGDITSRFGEVQTGLAATTIKVLEGIKKIKNFQTADATRTCLSAARHWLSDLSYQWVSQSGKSIGLLGTLLRPMTIFAIVAVLAVVFAPQGWTGLSATLPFFLLAPGLPDGLNVLIDLTQHMYESRMTAQSTADLPLEEPMPQDTFGQGNSDAPGRVEVDDVTFSYGPDAPVLKGVSSTTEPEAVATPAGPSGGGKSTLVQLVARSHDAGQGTVRISGIDVREAAFAWLLPQVTIVLQNVALTNNSVSDNIALGRSGATREQVEATARVTCAHDRIARLPKSYDTTLGEEGEFLSGGERQRITLARAYLQDTSILVLDEATVQADPQSERDIHQALTRLTEGGTVIIIAHRLTTIHDAGQVLVLEDGQIVERGRHDDLVTASGRYATMWRNQDLAPPTAAAREE